MKTLLVSILLLVTGLANAQTLEHDILTGDLALATDSHEVFIEGQDDNITILRFNKKHTKKSFFEIVNNYVDSHIDIVYYVPWTQNEENRYIYNCGISVEKHLFVLTYSTKSNRFIIRDMQTNIDRLVANY